MVGTTVIESDGHSQRPKYVQKLTMYVKRMLKEIQDRFQITKDQIIRKIAEMESRIDDLENNINNFQ